MKILFVSTIQVTFNVATPQTEPLGGTESCVCYLARQLAARGHTVTLLTHLPPGTPPMLMGVRHVHIDTLALGEFFAAETFDAIVTLNHLELVGHFRQLAPRALNLAWLHMFPADKIVGQLRDNLRLLDGVIFVSETQRSAFGLPIATAAIGNGIAPAFENMFASAKDLAAAKQDRAAYFSIPYRGLDVLAAAVPQTQSETQFDVYSGMRLYQSPEHAFMPLYRQIETTPRMRYHGAVDQETLAQRLKACAFLAYPCTVPETFGIVGPEAIAAGMKVVSTDLGALPETTLGFADLVTMTPGMSKSALAAEFAAHMTQAALEFHARREAWVEERFAQMQAVNRLCNWGARATAWEGFLDPLIAHKADGSKPRA